MYFKRNKLNKSKGLYGNYVARPVEENKYPVFEKLTRSIDAHLTVNALGGLVKPEHLKPTVDHTCRHKTQFKYSK